MTGERNSVRAQVVLAVGLMLCSALLVGCGGGGGGGDTSSAIPDASAPRDTGGAAETTPGGPDVPGIDTGCVPNCEGRECGSDPVCGQPCGTGCELGADCSELGRCVCTPECGDQQCGVDPVCRQSCGACPFGTQCSATNLCGPVDDLTCPAYFVCVTECAGDAACVADCVTATLEAERDLVGRVQACFDASCAACEDLDCLQACGSEHCGEDYLTCFSGDQICYQVYACVNDCVADHSWGTPDYDACRLDCLALGDPPAQEAYLALEVCIDEYCDRAAMEFTQFIECEQSRRHHECRNQSSHCPEL